jgi:hypothetical protein
VIHSSRGWTRFTDRDGEDHFEYAVALRLKHSSEDPALWTRELGMLPMHSQTAGKPRHTPNGSPLSGLAKQSFWISDLHLPSAVVDLPDAIEAICDLLSPRRETLRRIADTGGKAELFVGFVLERTNTGFELPAALLRSLGDLGLQLSFDIYDFNREDSIPPHTDAIAS